MGTLALAEASHRLPCFARLQATYGSIDTEAINLDGTGWFTKDPFEIYELFRKLTMTGLIIFIKSGTATQLAVGCMFGMGGVVIHLQTLPFADAVDAV